jgi:hypothetical protein
MSVNFSSRIARPRCEELSRLVVNRMLSALAANGALLSSMQTNDTQTNNTTGDSNRNGFGMSNTSESIRSSFPRAQSRGVPAPSHSIFRNIDHKATFHKI